MNLSRSLIFLWTPLSLILSILAIIITATLCGIAWKRSGYRRSVGLLELLRLTIVILIAVIFNQPEFIEEFRSEEKQSIALMWDASPSMETLDVIENSKTAISRQKAIEHFKDKETWSKLEKNWNVVIEPFSSQDQSHGSNLHAPLDAALEKHKNLRSVVLVSDGDWNEGKPPVQAATRLRLKGIPVYPVAVGSTTQLPDVELLSLNAPTFGVAGKTVRIPFTIKSSLPRDYIAKATLRSSDGEEISKEIRIAPMGRSSDSILWKSPQTGDYTLTLEIPPHVDETITDNNKLTAPIAIREEKLRVLVVESYPRWEYRYLRNALSRDPGVDVSCLLFHPGLGKVGGGNKDYIKSFPDGLDELSKFDVIFLGDVGIEDGQLTVEQCNLLKGLVEHQASGLVFMPGWQGRQASLLETDLKKLYPVMLDDAQPGGWGARVPCHFELTELGRRSLLTKLADTQEDNLEVWDGLPGFQWYAPVLRARAGSEVLCVHKDISNKYGRLPLLVTRTYGAGKTLFMGTDGAWRWRKGVEDKYHYRFWGQVVRWMAYQRNMAKGETMRLYYSPEQPLVKQTVTLNANVMEESGEPLVKGDVTARIVAPSGQAKTIRFQSSSDSWGAFFSRFTTEEPGKHNVTLTCKQTNAVLETSFFVQGDIQEAKGKPARPEVLEEIALVSHGEVFEPHEVDKIIQLLAQLPELPPNVQRVQLWSHPILAGTVIFLLGIFWIFRKVVGLI